MEEDDVFEDAKEELPEQIDTALHEAVFRNDLPEISALLRAAKERSQVRITCNIKYLHSTFNILLSTFYNSYCMFWKVCLEQYSCHLRSKLWLVQRTTKATQPCTWQ